MNFEERLTSFRSDVFSQLRPSQQTALDGYQELRDAGHRDIGVELPTGAGKTLIALLIADDALERGLSVAYLTGTRQLSNQVLEQAATLPGLDAYQFSGKNYPASQLLAYNQAEALGVMNYWVYFNSSPKVETADVVIFDDAHLAEQSLSGMFTLRIDRQPGLGVELYRLLCQLILQSAPGMYPTLQALHDGAAPNTSPPELIAFADWAAVAPAAHQALEKADLASLENGAQFVWRTIRPYLRRCGVLIGPTSIEIRPYHTPTQTIPGYARSKERVYLSATLGQAGDIQRRLGTHRVATTAPIAADEKRLGRRTFLINPTLTGALEGATWSFAMDQVREAAKHSSGRVAWLCASNAEADAVTERLEEGGYSVFRLRAGDDSAVDRWKTRPFAHLVTAGRFDGLDFPDDVCRLVIIPTVPAASTEFERFVVAYLGDASYMRYRIGQRLTQALGRANRTPTDAALYLGLDPAFGPALSEPAVQAALGVDVRAAVGQGFLLHGGPWEPVAKAAGAFWDDKTVPAPAAAEGTATTRRTRPGRQATGIGQVDSAAEEVTAATQLWMGNFAGSLDAANAAATLLDEKSELEHAAFWKYVQAHAHYEQGGPAGSDQAEAALLSAVEAAPQTAWFVRLQRTLNAMSGRPAVPTHGDRFFLSWDEWIRDGGVRLVNLIDRARTSLEDEGSGFVEALQVLGRLAGANSSSFRGPRAMNARWVWADTGSGQRRIWAAFVNRDEDITREDVNEVVGLALEEETLNSRSDVVGCLVSSSETVTAAARQAASNSRVALVSADSVRRLFAVLAERFLTYQSASGSGSAIERGAARNIVAPRLAPGDWLESLLRSKSGEFIVPDDIDAIFDGL